MNEEQLIVASVTGVEIEFQIAGPGSRSYAFVVDWHIRFLLALAWFLIALLLINQGWTLAITKDKPKVLGFIVALPALVLYFFYHPILEVATRGRTPGKRIAGVRIVTREGDIPSIGALLIRNLFRIVDSLPALYVIGLITTIVSKQHVRIGDMAAGTLLIVDHDREGKSLENFAQLSQRTHLDPRTADLIDELLQRWKMLSDDNRRKIAANLLTRIKKQIDPQIDAQTEMSRLASLSSSELHERLQRALEDKQQ